MKKQSPHKETYPYGKMSHLPNKDTQAGFGKIAAIALLSGGLALGTAGMTFANQGSDKTGTNIEQKIKINRESYTNKGLKLLFKGWKDSPIPIHDEMMLGNGISINLKTGLLTTPHKQADLHGINKPNEKVEVTPGGCSGGIVLYIKEKNSNNILIYEVTKNGDIIKKLEGVEKCLRLN